MSIEAFDQWEEDDRNQELKRMLNSLEIPGEDETLIGSDTSYANPSPMAHDVDSEQEDSSGFTFRESGAPSPNQQPPSEPTTGMEGHSPASSSGFAFQPTDNIPTLHQYLQQAAVSLKSSQLLQQHLNIQNQALSNENSRLRQELDQAGIKHRKLKEHLLLFQGKYQGNGEESLSCLRGQLLNEATEALEREHKSSWDQQRRYKASMRKVEAERDHAFVRTEALKQQLQTLTEQLAQRTVLYSAQQRETRHISENVVNELKNDLSAAKAKVDSLQSELERVDGARTAQTERAAKLESEKSTLSNDLKALQQDLADFKSQLAKSEARSGQLEAEVAALRNADVDAAHQEFGAELQRLQSQADARQREAAAMAREAQSLAEERGKALEDLRKEKATWEAELRALSRSKAMNDERLELLEGKQSVEAQADLMAQVDYWKQKAEELIEAESNLNDLREEMKTVMQERNTANDLNKSLQKSLSEAKEMNQTLKKELEQLKESTPPTKEAVITQMREHAARVLAAEVQKLNAESRNELDIKVAELTKQKDEEVQAVREVCEELKREEVAQLYSELQHLKATCAVTTEMNPIREIGFMAAEDMMARSYNDVMMLLKNFVGDMFGEDNWHESLNGSSFGHLLEATFSCVSKEIQKERTASLTAKTETIHVKNELESQIEKLEYKIATLKTEVEEARLETAKAPAAARLEWEAGLDLRLDKLRSEIELDKENKISSLNNKHRIELEALDAEMRTLRESHRKEMKEFEKWATNEKKQAEENLVTSYEGNIEHWKNQLEEQKASKARIQDQYLAEIENLQKKLRDAAESSNQKLREVEEKVEKYQKQLNDFEIEMEGVRADNASLKLDGEKARLRAEKASEDAQNCYEANISKTLDKAREAWMQSHEDEVKSYKDAIQEMEEKAEMNQRESQVKLDDFQKKSEQKLAILQQELEETNEKLMEMQKKSILDAELDQLEDDSLMYDRGDSKILMMKQDIYDQQIESLKRDHEAEITALRKRNELTFLRLKKKHENIIESMEESHRREVIHLKDALETAKRIFGEQVKLEQASKYEKDIDDWEEKTKKMNGDFQERVSEMERLMKEQSEGYLVLLKNKDEELEKLKQKGIQDQEKLQKDHEREKEQMRQRVELAFQKMQKKWQKDQKKLEQVAKREAKRDLQQSELMEQKEKEIGDLKSQMKQREADLLDKIHQRFSDEKQKLVQSLTQDLELSNKHEIMNLEAHYKDRIKEMTEKWNAEKQSMVQECEHILAQTLELKDRMCQQQRMQRKAPTSEAYTQTKPEIKPREEIHPEMLTPKEAENLVHSIIERSSYDSELDASLAAYRKHIQRKSNQIK